MFIVVIAVARPGCGRAGRRGVIDRRRRRGRRRAGIPLADLARQALQDPARAAVCPARPVAGRRRRPDRALPGTGRCAPSRRSAKRITARRDEDLRQADENYQEGLRLRRGPARREAAADQRGLRSKDGRCPDHAAARACARPSTCTTAAWPSSRRSARSSLPKLEEKYKAFKQQIKERYETGWNALADRWHAGMASAAAELDAINHEVAGYCPPWDDPAWPGRALPRVVPPVIRFGTFPVELAPPCPAGSRPTHA